MKNLLLALSITALISAPAFAADAKKDKKAAEEKPADLPASEKVNVDNIKEKYWARGEESELGVVQNRAYSKGKKFEFSLFVGSLASDPFMSVNSLGASVGYNFDEYLSAHLIAWKAFWRRSSAMITLEEGGKIANINPPYGFIGASADWSLLYGKLSLVGKKIIYYDMYISGGAGMTFTESGNNFTPFAGIGQKIYVSQSTSIKFDYKLMYYNETILEKTVTPLLYTPRGTRSNFTHSITIGVDFLIGIFK